MLYIFDFQFSSKRLLQQGNLSSYSNLIDSRTIEFCFDRCWDIA